MDIGLYGKLPTHGDFLRRRVADDFVAAWDPWLQHCLAESRRMLGEPWLETYLTSPVWRFALAPHVCGAAPVAGLLVPSMDRVGRYFPLTLVWRTPIEESTLEIATQYRQGFERAERLVLDTLALEHFEFADFDRRVMELADHLAAAREPGTVRLARAAGSAASLARARCIPLRSAAALEAPAIQLLGWQLDENPVALWWTDGSAAITPSWLITRGLPQPAQYSAMLDGAWAEAGWQVAAAHGEHESRASEAHEGELGEGFTIRSAALSDRGPVRSTNQDAFIERPEVNLWAVADGMGGLSEGELASRMVCDALADAPLVATLDEQVEVVLAQLRGVNDYLHRAATRPVHPVQSGSTVVALLIRGRECAVLWAGDSRLYRLRDGRVAQITTDHAWVAPGAQEPDPMDSQAITRAVGAEESFEPDILRGDVRAHDRYLLCSDGVGRALEPTILAGLLQTEDAAACCAALIAESIAHGGTDNATAVVIDCVAPEAIALAVPIDGLTL